MWNIYLSGEIHTDWREQIISRCEALKLPVNFSSAITDHAASDAAGDHLADTATSFWRDNQSAKVNAIRTKNLIAQASCCSFCIASSTNLQNEPEERRGKGGQ